MGLFNKKSQITIFVIFGLIIIVVFLLLYFLMNIQKKVRVEPDNTNPAGYIEVCAREATDEAIDILSVNGGDISPRGYLNYDGEKIVYLCFNENYYERCINQRPLLVEHLENEITRYITPKIQNCFDKLESGIKRTSEQVDLSNEMKIKTSLYPEQILVEINRDLKFYRGKDLQEYHKFKMFKPHMLYDFAKISMEIVNQESEYCNFDLMGYMIAYPRWDIKSIITGNSDTIYTLTDRSTNQKFQFAIKTCLMPAGF